MRKTVKARKLRRPAEDLSAQATGLPSPPPKVMERSTSAPQLPTIDEDGERSGLEADIEDNEGVSEDPVSDSEVGFQSHHLSNESTDSS